MLYVVFGSLALVGSLAAADTRLLVVSIQLPPPDAIEAASRPDPVQAGRDKINGWGNIQPEKFAKRMIKGLVVSDILPKTTSGIMGIYGGYFGYSDQAGNLTFPLRHTGSKVDVIFTPSIDLERLYQETYSGIFINQKTLNDSGAAPAMLPMHYVYSLEMSTTGAAATTPQPADVKSDAAKKTGEPEENWVVTKSTVAMDTRLPTNAVIILVNPANIFVPVGMFSTSSKPHLVLPDMYMIGKKFNDAVLMNNLKNMKYFEEITIASGTSTNKNVQIQQSVVVND